MLQIPKTLKFGDPASIKYKQDYEKKLELQKVILKYRYKTRLPICRGCKKEMAYMYIKDIRPKEKIIEWYCQECKGTTLTTYRGKVLDNPNLYM